MLKHPKLLLNEATVQGSTPAMVAAKYGNAEVLRVLLKDDRVDMHRKDNSGRSLPDLVGVADLTCSDNIKRQISELIVTEFRRRECLKKKKNCIAKSKWNN